MLSNHPSTLWSENQLQLAQQLYDTVIDLPFPHVDSNFNSDHLEMQLEEYEINVRKANPSAVHVRGELTFTYLLVNRLKAIGINCIASTTERKTIMENNHKTSKFQSIQFRPY